VPRILLLLPTATYRAPDFVAAAGRLGADVVVGSEHTQAMASTMGDRAVVVPLETPDAAVEAIVAAHARTPFDAVVAVDDQGVIIAALAAERLGLRGNPPDSVAATRDKGAMRQRLAAASVPQPDFRAVPPGGDAGGPATAVGFPCVVKPVSRSGSQGVIRAEGPAGAREAAERIRAIVGDAGAPLLVERFVPGEEVAVEGLLDGGRLEVLAVFDKPDPMDGPYFEETIYVTPSRQPRAVLDRIEAGGRGGGGIARVDLAAEVLGSSHALDRGTKAEAAVTRALRRCFPGSDTRDAWEQAGIQMDLVSAPALSWGLRATPSSPLARLLDEAVRLGIPVHLSQLALRAHPVAVAAGTDVLVVENPRIVEAAAQSRTPFPVVGLNGNPAGAVLLLLDQLLSSKAALRYHGDFDAAGLRICARMHDLGLVPFEMDRAGYLAAVDDARTRGAPLPIDPHPAPATPWDPALQAAFDACRRVVHEERLLSTLLRPTGAASDPGS